MGEGVSTIGKNTRKTDRSYQRDTEKGLNKRESYTLSKLENSIRDRETEKGYFVDSEGNVLGESYTRSKTHAAFKADVYRRAMNKDAVLTHNHPKSFDGIAGRIGNPFSTQDILSAAQLNLKEVRAVTTTYNFSIRRPKGGWPDVNTLKRALRASDRKMRAEARNYMNAQRARGVLSYDERVGRANTGIQYAQMKELAKQFGWEFTRRKVGSR